MREIKMNEATTRPQWVPPIEPAPAAEYVGELASTDLTERQLRVEALKAAIAARGGEQGWASNIVNDANVLLTFLKAGDGN